MSNIIHAENLTLSYKKDQEDILSNISFNVHKGEFVFITGLSGSGKSTLLKSIYGELKPKMGSLTVVENDLVTIKSKQLEKFRRKLGIVFQDYKLINEWTIEENIRLPLKIAKATEKTQLGRMPLLLAHANLFDILERYPLELSGGEQQRVGVVRALVHEPLLILADEPTGNLDAESSAVIWKLLGEASSLLDITVLVVTHQIPKIFAFPHRHLTIKEKGLYEL